jgi:transmembrane sensor
MEEKEIQVLLNKYINGECTEQETILVETVYLMDNKSYSGELSEQDINEDITKVLASLPQPVKQSKLLAAIAVAAGIIIFLLVGFYFFSVKNSPQIAKTKVSQNDVAPGKNIAILTLSNGKAIALSDAKKGVVLAYSELSYNDGSPVDEKLIEGGYTTMNTPIGGQYGLTLSDGTKIILNAASSVKFPSSFKGQANRTIELNGEAYFEVAKDQKHPFIVKTADQTVEVLGTHFNISSYTEDAATTTTLLEGAVKVASLSKVLTRELKPGQQSSLSGNGISIVDVEAEDAVAWKNGYFMFNYETLEDVMVKLSRWYGIKVEYEDPGVKDAVFFGTVSKYENISKVLNMLERTGVVKFQVKDRTLKIYSTKRN